jgi:biotin carboxylase
MNHIKKIAIIGASYLQLPLVLKCKELGYKSLCFAYLDGAICKDYCDEFYDISILEKEKITEICKEQAIDAVLTIASDVAVTTVNYVATALNLVGNSNDSSLICTDKNKMKDAFATAKLPIANYVELYESSELVKVKRLKYPLIVKPSDRSGSLGVTKIMNEEQLNSAFQLARNCSLKKTVIIEEFITGNEISVESISYDGEHYFLAFTDKVTSGAPHFVELEHHQPANLTPNATKQIQELLTKALTTLGIMNGAAHSELIIDEKNNIFINEIGARMGGDFIGSHLVELSTGYDYLNGAIEVSLNRFSPPKIENKGHSGVLFLSSQTNYESRFLSQRPEIVHYEINEIKKDMLTKSSDRNGYCIYQSNKKINFDSI